MDSQRLKDLDRRFGTPLVRLLALVERLLVAIIPGRARRGSDLEGLRNIAIIKTIAIGDVTMALPALAALRRRFPEARITFITTPRVREVVEGMPYADEILYLDVFGAHAGVLGVARFAGQMRRRHFDAVIELEHYYRFTTILSYLSGARVRVGYDIEGQVRKGLFTIAVPYPVEMHERDSILSIPQALGATWQPDGYVPIPTSDEDERVVDGWLDRSVAVVEADRAVGSPGRSVSGTREALAAGSRKLPLLLLHTTTSPIATSRRWSDDRWVELARRITVRSDLLPVLTGVGEDAAGLEALGARMGMPVLVAAGHLSLKQFAVLASRATLVVSVDTGPLHVAAATGTPTVGLFGSTWPVKWGPYGSRNTFVWAHLDCSPCTRHWMGQISTCTRGDCMEAISVDDVMAAIDTLPERPCEAAGT